MSVRTAQEMLRSEIDSLPETLVDEVLDFVLFAKSRRKEEAFLWEQVEETRAHRERYPEEVVTVTADEWDALTADTREDH